MSGCRLGAGGYSSLAGDDRANRFELAHVCRIVSYIGD